MKRLLLVSTVLATSIFLYLGIRSAPAAAQSACAYQCAFYDGGYVYFIRADGVLVRLGVNDKAILAYPNPAPAGHYVALIGLGGSGSPSVLAVRDDGSTYYLNGGSLNNQWEPFVILPPCSPVPVSPSTLGAIKSKYR